jgi:hypothetical protein
MEIPERRKQGKNVLVKVLTPNSSEINMPAFQKRMKRVNNCNATSWKCAYCKFTKRMACFKNTVRSFQLEALQKYGDTPQMKKAIEERTREEKLKVLTENLKTDIERSDIT